MLCDVVLKPGCVTYSIYACTPHATGRLTCTHAHPFVGDAMFPYRSYEHLFVIGRYQSGHQIPFNEDEIDHGECSSQQVGKEEQKVTDKMKLSSS